MNIDMVLPMYQNQRRKEDKNELVKHDGWVSQLLAHYLLQYHYNF